MKFSRQLFLIFVYCLIVLFSLFSKVIPKFDQTIRIPIIQVYYLTGLVIFFCINASFCLFMFEWYLETYPKRLSEKYLHIDSSEFDYQQFKNKSGKSDFKVIQPISSLIVCTPYLYYHFSQHYELGILFGIIANFTLLLLGLPNLIQYIVMPFLFMRHLDRITNDPT